MKRYKVKQVIDLLKADGWELKAQERKPQAVLPPDQERESDSERKRE